MSLSNDAKNILVVAMANASKAAEISDAIDANTVASASSAAANVLDAAARNTNFKIANVMIATTGDATTDAATLGVVVGDFVIEVSVAGAAVTASGVVTVDDNFVGVATVGSVLIHLQPIV